MREIPDEACPFNDEIEAAIRKNKRKNQMTLQLRVGGVYRSRAGDRVEIINRYTSGGATTFVDADECLYNSKGSWGWDDGEYGYDLIAEWDEPAADFSGDQLIKSLQDAIAVLDARIAKLEPKELTGTYITHDTTTTPSARYTLESELDDLQFKVAKLEARVAEIEPKPTVESVWWSLNAHNSCHWTQPPRPDSFSSSVFVVRHDTITAPDGSVTYACEAVNERK